MRYLSLFVLAFGCHNEAQLIKPDPDFVRCDNEQQAKENACFDAGTRAEFDDCIARTRKSCVDGGK